MAFMQAKQVAHLCFSSCDAAVSFLAAMRSQSFWSKLMMFSATSLPSCRHQCWCVSAMCMSTGSDLVLLQTNLLLAVRAQQQVYKLIQCGRFLEVLGADTNILLLCPAAQLASAALFPEGAGSMSL